LGWLPGGLLMRRCHDGFPFSLSLNEHSKIKLKN
jgi:hypothetical protein